MNITAVITPITYNLEVTETELWSIFAALADTRNPNIKTFCDKNGFKMPEDNDDAYFMYCKLKDLLV